MHVNSTPSQSARFAPGTGPALFNPDAAPTKVRKLKFGDCHFHPTNYAQQGTPPEQLLPTMARLGIKYTVLAPIPTNVLVRCCGTDQGWAPAEGRAVDATSYYIALERVKKSFLISGEEYEAFIRDEAPLYYNTAVDSSTAHDFNQLSAENKASFDPMVTGLVLGDARCSEDLLRKLSEHPGVFTGVGEITIFKEWVQRKVDDRLQANLTDRVNALKLLVKTCATIGMPMVIHCDVNPMPHERAPADIDLPQFLEDMKAFLKDPQCRGTTIIWAHAAGLGKYSRITNGHLERVASLLRDPELAHLSIDISWDTVAKQLMRDADEKAIDPVKVEKFRVFLETFQDRILFGSDSLSPNTDAHWNETAEHYQPIFKNLTKEARNKVKLGNYERLLVGARAKVRAYEKHCLAYAMVLVKMRTDNALPAEVKSALRLAVENGIAYGQACAAFELDPAAHPQPDASRFVPLIEVSELQKVAWQILPGDGLDLGKMYLGPLKNHIKPAML
jgi:hypothetical protein